MRIEPKRDTLASPQPAASAASDDDFARELKTATGPFHDTPSIAPFAKREGPPPAEQWGTYGLGATEEGYGTPNPGLYADAPVGPDKPASPLNPNGVTMTGPFLVSGYTGRGTPIPPGFYNLAYYNMYLREGGTPLVGFPELEAGANITETYGTFGDGAKRATSYLTGLVDTSTPDAPAATDAPAADAVTASAELAPAATPAATARATAASPTPASVIQAATKIATAAASGNETAAAAEAGAPAPAAALPAATTVLASRDAAATLLRSELSALLADLLRSA